MSIFWIFWTWECPPFELFEPENVHLLNFLNLRMSTFWTFLNLRMSTFWTFLTWECPPRLPAPDNQQLRPCVEKFKKTFFSFFLLTGRGECRGKVYKLSPEINVFFWNTSLLVAWFQIICKVLEVKQLDHVGIFVFSPRRKVDQNPERFGPSKVQVFFHLFDKMTKIWTR